MTRVRPAYDTTFAAFGPISLTSVDQSGYRIGANAARLLVERIADRNRPTSQVKLPHPGSPPQHRPPAGLSDRRGAGAA